MLTPLPVYPADPLDPADPANPLAPVMSSKKLQIAIKNNCFDTLTLLKKRQRHSKTTGKSMFSPSYPLILTFDTKCIQTSPGGGRARPRGSKVAAGSGQGQGTLGGED